MLDILTKRHILPKRTIPFLSVAYDTAENFIALPFYFVEAMSYLVRTFIINQTVNQNEKIPI